MVSSQGKPLLLTVLLALLYLAIPASQRTIPTLVTKRGEWRTLTLEDGTVATLGPDTVLTPVFTHDRRSVDLVGGEVLFNVKKDPRRPFVVRTSVGCVKALGTIFSVAHQPRRTSVTTQEGIVAAARRDQADPNCATGIRLIAGQKAVIESWAPLVARAVDINVEHAWTNRQIIFTGQSVERALREFNRRSWVQLDVPADPEFLKMKVFGRFTLDDPKPFAHYLDRLHR